MKAEGAVVRSYSTLTDVKVGGLRHGPVIALFPYTRNFIPCHLSPSRYIKGYRQIVCLNLVLRVSPRPAPGASLLLQGVGIAETLGMRLILPG